MSNQGSISYQGSMTYWGLIGYGGSMGYCYQWVIEGQCTCMRVTEVLLDSKMKLHQLNKKAMMALYPPHLCM